MARNLAALKKHKDNDHALSFNSSGPLDSVLVPVKHSTRNNSISEALMQEDVSSTNLTNQSNANVQEDVFKYTCLECNFSTTEKAHLEDHIINHHDCTGLGNMNFKCVACQCEFDGEDQYQTHIKTHDSQMPTVVNQVKCKECTFE